MKKSILLSVFTLCFSALQLFSQVAKTSIVEHFTNTSCSVCANNNPGIYSTLNANPSVLHVSFHPSSPYTSDFFSQSNQIENDARTQFYGVFGSTPRTVLNGGQISYSTLNTALPLLSAQTSNFQFIIKQNKISIDSFLVETTIKKVANDTSINALLFAGAIEDTVFQNTNNGETIHYNVFRKSLTITNGLWVNLPIVVGDSIVVYNAYKAGATWQVDKMNTIGILQHANKVLINSSRSINTVSVTTGIFESNSSEIGQFVYPNPSNGNIYTKESAKHVNIYDVNGRSVGEFQNLKPNQILDISKLNKGTYFFINKDMDMQQIQKIILK